MKTYIIQYNKNGHWQNYLANDKTTVEFLFLNHARSVAADLGAFVGTLPYSKKHWQIVDSTGMIYTMEWFR